MSIILISAPAFSYVTNSSQCDNDVLSTYTGPANLTANWQGNNISVTWYNGDTEYDSNQCTYGGELDVPTAPTKTGYTFKGWRV
ncbi:MAG: InlB B-repeat-containing protein, partial [Alphaproteobacteria bacterium]